MNQSDGDDILLFGDFPSVHGTGAHQPAQINVNSPEHHSGKYGFGGSAANDGGNINTNGNSDNSQEGSSPKMVSFLSIQYYQQFFNVDSVNVVDRIASSMIPKRAPSNYLRSHIGLNPDLYGPIWITTTLIFSIAISGNIASYLQYAHTIEYHWRYNFHLVSYAATTIFLYSFLIPIALWGLFKWSLKPLDDDLESENVSYTPSLLSLICVYGYSLAIYIPVSILWVIQISLLQWLLVLTAAFLSGSVLISVLSPALKNSKISLLLLIGIVAAHFLLAAGFMLFFFHVPSTPTEKVVEQVLHTVTNNISKTV